MWMPKVEEEKKDSNAIVAVAVDKDKSSQYALKWAIDHLLGRGQTVTLIHVKQKSAPIPSGPNDVISPFKPSDAINKEIFLPFRCFCSRKEIKCHDVVLEELDIGKAISEYVSHSGIDTLVLGAASRNSFLRTFKPTDVPTVVTKSAPDFCTVYVISKGKVSSVKTASRAAPSVARPKIQTQTQEVARAPEPPEAQFARSSTPRAPQTPVEQRSFQDELDAIRSPFGRAGGRGHPERPYGEYSNPDTDISYVSSGRPSVDRMFPSLYDNFDPVRTPPRLSNSSDMDGRKSFESLRMGGGPRSVDLQYSSDFSMISQDSKMSSSSSNMDEVEAEMRRLKLELKQTMDMYSSACKEALSAKQKAMELHRWKMEEEHRLHEARMAEENALAMAQKEKAKCMAALEAAEAAQRIAELEAHKRMSAELKAMKESEDKKRALNALAHSDLRYRKYTIEEIEAATECFAEERKIGEGGYGPVYKCYLDHTPVAIKVLRPDAAQGRSQFQQEYGCLVYEYMANGSLDDCLFRRGNGPILSWQLRFRCSRNRNRVALSTSNQARALGTPLVPPSVANTVTQYRMTSTAGTFCYIDPEYQQTGMLGIKSDVYSLGIMLLQIITAKPPMGLTHHVERSIERGQFAEMLDPDVPDWPVEEVMVFAKLALQCAELRRKDRPDLGKVVLPELNRLRGLAEDNMDHIMIGGTGGGYSSSSHSQVSSVRQEMMSDPLYTQSGYDSSRSRTSVASLR
ncbi:hypothetical protein MKW92_016863 [Papaver armeniacum]|nr:hypothetical protein MKW92_016863 [Papaver armeniacum]